MLELTGLALLVGLLIPSLAAAQVVESTSFEADPADGGWELGFPICGSTCDDGCGHHPSNGWFGGSPNCLEPRVAAENPATGLQHLRFVADPGGLCGPGSCPTSAFTPNAGGPLPIGPTTISYRLAQNASAEDLPWGSSFHYFTNADGGTGSRDRHYFSSYGVAYFFDTGLGEFYGMGYISGSGVYDSVTVHYDPCNDTVTYTFNGSQVQQSAGMAGVDQWVSFAVFWHDNGPDDWDLDDVSIVRGEPCRGTCGDNIAEWDEECDGTDDGSCPGPCLPSGDPNECTCAPTGACCIETTGACTDDVSADQCRCVQCTWSENEVCSAVQCEPSAVPVPTLSEWGLAALAILLVAGLSRAVSTRGRLTDDASTE